MEELRKPTTELEFKQMYEGFFEDATKFMIVAGEYRQAKDFAHVMRIPNGEWKYVERASDLNGYRNIVIVTLGGMYRKEGIHEIMDTATVLARMKFAELTHVEDWR